MDKVWDCLHSRLNQWFLFWGWGQFCDVAKVMICTYMKIWPQLVRTMQVDGTGDLTQMELGIWFCAWFWFQFQFWFLKIRAACGQVVGNLARNLEPLVSSSSSLFFSNFFFPKNLCSGSMHKSNREPDPVSGSLNLLNSGSIHQTRFRFISTNWNRTF